MKIATSQSPAGTEGPLLALSVCPVGQPGKLTEVESGVKMAKPEDMLEPVENHDNPIFPTQIPNEPCSGPPSQKRKAKNNKWQEKRAAKKQRQLERRELRKAAFEGSGAGPSTIPPNSAKSDDDDDAEPEDDSKLKEHEAAPGERDFNPAGVPDSQYQRMQKRSLGDFLVPLPPGLMPVGRLDNKTTGLILLSSEGDLSAQVHIYLFSGTLKISLIHRANITHDCSQNTQSIITHCFNTRYIKRIECRSIDNICRFRYLIRLYRF